jgi:ZIP family zinc transporter
MQGVDGMTTTQVAAVMLLSLMSLLTTWMGVALAIRLRQNAPALAAGIGFSVGIMLLISLLELLPEASAALGPRMTALGAALGAGLVWSAHLIVPHTHLADEAGWLDRSLVKSVYLVMFGLILHDVPEGFAMANAYIASPSLGLLVSLAIALHNVPEEFAMAVPAVTLRSRRVLYGAAAASALAEPAGALLGLMATGIAPGLNAHFMAFAAGAMVYVSIHELIPMARRYRHAGHVVAGMAASVAVYVLLEALTL